MESHTAKAIEHIDRQIGKFEELLKELTTTRHDAQEGELEEKYDGFYDETEYVLKRYFPLEDLNKFRDNIVNSLHSKMHRGNDSGFFGLIDDYPVLEDYVQASKQCISNLRMYRARIEEFGSDTPHHLNVEELFMGDKYENTYGDITDSTFIVAQGKQNTVIATLNAAGQTELAQALKTLTDAVLASQSLSDNDKKEHVEMINDIGEEAAKPKPNKRKLKSLADGLVATLKAIPDVAKAVIAIMPMFNQLHL